MGDHSQVLMWDTIVRFPDPHWVLFGNLRVARGPLGLFLAPATCWLAPDTCGSKTSRLGARGSAQLQAGPSGVPPAWPGVRARACTCTTRIGILILSCQETIHGASVTNCQSRWFYSMVAAQDKSLVSLVSVLRLVRLHKTLQWRPRFQKHGLWIEGFVITPE